MEQRNSVNIYGCGGCGTNLLNLLRKSPPVGADYNAYYIDTSRSDLVSGQDMSKVYLIPGCDGSGKDPAVNYEKIVAAMPQIMGKFQPAEINLIPTSLSGGSGNIIAMSVAEACWAEGKNVIFFAIASREDLQATTNVRNSLANARNTARKYGKHAIMYYDDNQMATQDSSVDRDAITSLSAFLEIYSGNHTRLDSRDIHNWLNPKVPPQLLLLDITTSYPTASATDSLVSIATLYDSETTRTAPIPAAYSCEGVRKLECGHNLYMTISAGEVNNIVDSVVSTITDYKQQVSKVSTGAVRGLDKLGNGSTGMVFDD